MTGLGGKVADKAEPTPAGVRLSFDVAVLLRDSLDGYSRILGEYESQGTSSDLRAAALQLARRIAAYERLAIISAEDMGSLPEALSPNPGLAVLRDLGYALVALGQEEPDASTLLSAAELEQVLEATKAEAWMSGVLDAIPDDWEAT